METHLPGIGVMPLLQLISDCSQVHGVLDDVEIILCGGERRELHGKIERINRGGEGKEIAKLTGMPSRFGSTGSQNGQASGSCLCTRSSTGSRASNNSSLENAAHTHTHRERSGFQNLHFYRSLPFLREGSGTTFCFPEEGT